jgi:hypothetical protein
MLEEDWPNFWMGDTNVSIKGQGIFIKIAPENPVLWTGMKGASGENRKQANQMLKQY